LNALFQNIRNARSFLSFLLKVVRTFLPKHGSLLGIFYVFNFLASFVVLSSSLLRAPLPISSIPRPDALWIGGPHLSGEPLSTTFDSFRSRPPSTLSPMAKLLLPNLAQQFSQAPLQSFPARRTDHSRQVLDIPIFF